MKHLNLRLYLVTDEACLPPGRDLFDAVEEALQAGVTLVQYREKNGLGKGMLEKARAMTALCHKYNVPLLVNDRLDIALLSGADGVHLGQDDIPVSEARRMANQFFANCDAAQKGGSALPLTDNRFIIGATAHNVEEALAAEAAGADYLGCGAVFSTTTKKDTVPLGLEGLTKIRNAVRIPIVGIAGVTAENYPQVLSTGANGAAVVSGILAAESITEAVHRFKSDKATSNETAQLFKRCPVYQADISNKDNDLEYKRVLIVGAGEAGNIILRDLRKQDHRKVIGFIDDDPLKQNKVLNGVPVLGTRYDIHNIVNNRKIEEIIIAIPSMHHIEMNKLAELCNTAKPDVTVKIMPSFFTTVDEGSISYQTLRPLQIEDLLNRDSVKVDMATFGKYLEDKTVLVTGAGGSIGSEICRQVLWRKPRKLILLGRGEGSIYEINRELQDRAEKGQVIPYIMNITNKEGMDETFRKFRPQIVFHAAAHKHVPLMEYQPREAVQNNVEGFFYTADSAGRYGVERFVLISTDKAVNPTSVMGATKRLTEKLCQILNEKHPKTKYVAVRFGNVLGSRGSVVPLFKKQIEDGGPVTVTHPEMTRYFMTILEASQLVIESGSMGNGGEVYILDMGKPVKIVDLAKNMIKLSGLVLDKDIKICFTGLRPGEKMSEELLTAEEGTAVTSHAKIWKATLSEEDATLLKQQFETLITLKDADAIIAQLQKMIPTYTPNRII